MNFYENLAVRYGTLTKQGRRVADYIRAFPENTLKMTAKTLGAKSGTSAAAVIRFCQQMGYESLESMKISLAKGVNSEDLTTPIDTIISGSDTIAGIAQKLYHNTQDALQKTLGLLDHEDVKQVVSLLQKAQRIYLFGVGSSGLAASELCHRLNRIGKPCIFLHDSHTNLEYASVADKKDVMICFSYSGETKEIYLAAERAKRNDVPVIAVTRDRTSSLSVLATIVLRIPESEKRVRVGAFASITSQMFITDILYMSIIQKDFEKYEKMLVETSRIANRLRE